ncbi:PROTEIN YIPPEE-LIKE CG15309-RELATED [Salix viminalis]|uniref:PROTEIN YIPPEE-LIKE CG15309-RELATED n=1 Tax=Salix viminalis TaxID=40686 RepID=A0A9Q0TZE8_SALVM|nr:PROTEIN YIPPEE-LIKE CG15309-RELATED [Salix viminalis]
MGRLFVEELEGRSYSCKHCGTHLALHGDIISKAFSLISCCFWFVIEFVAQSVFSSSCYLSFTKRLASKMLYPIRHGKAYLFRKVANVFAGEKEDRSMLTGLHTVADIFCVGCGSIVGWKYVTAHDKSQKYKEGKSVLERFKLSGPDGSYYWVHEHHHISGSDADDV